MKRHSCVFNNKFLPTIIFLLIVTFVIPCGLFAFNGENNTVKKRIYKQNEIIVRFKKNVNEDIKREIREELNAKIIKISKSINIEHWKLPDDIDIDDITQYMKNLPSIEHAEPNYYLRQYRFPDDPKFNELWYQNNTGQVINGTGGTPGSDISSIEAWDIETGDGNVIIAVIDSGVAIEHPDLKNNMWRNLNEIQGNNIDDDNNGYVDDYLGWDFVNNDNNPSDYSKDLYGDGHGTHVAGIIAAQGNNNIGTTGVMWRAKIMPLQVFDIFQTNTFEGALIQSINIILAIEYAVDNDAKIINCSFGGASYSQFQYDVMNYAHQNGVLIVIAAGNSSNNNDTVPFYPASYNLPNIISVAATDENDAISSYSNYGVSSVDVAAPGGSGTMGNIYSTIPPERIVLFSDDFESGGSKWTTSGIYEEWFLAYNSVFGSTVVQDSFGNYYNNENSTIATLMPINTSNYRGLHLQFKILHSLESNYDFIYFEGSGDGTNFITLDYGTGIINSIYDVNYWTNDFELGSLYLRFRLSTDYLYSYDGVYIDDIILTGVPSSFIGNEYGYKSGTSMAAPVVTGIAGLIYSLNPNITHLEIKDIILKSVDKLGSLSGRVFTGGRVNAYRALTYNNKAPLSKAMPWIPLLLLNE